MIRELLYADDQHSKDNRDGTTVHKTPLDNVQELCYLGSTMSKTNSLTEELDTRIGKAATVYGCPRKRMWDNNNLSVALTVEVYEACIGQHPTLRH